MAWIAPDGRPVEAPPDRSRPRGRHLSLESCLRLRDLLAALLVWGCRLSKPDAAYVLSQCAMTEDNLRRRLDKCPTRAGAIIEELCKAAGGNSDD